MNAYRRGVRLSVTIAPKVSAAIDRLLATGLFGRTRAEVAQRLIYDGVGKQPWVWTGLGPERGMEPRKKGRTR